MRQITDELVASMVAAVKASAKEDALGMYHHPLYVGFPLPELPEAPGTEAFKRYRLENIIRAKLEALEEVKEEGNFHAVLFLTERPYRLQALLNLLEEDVVMAYTSTYHDLLRRVWVDCEHPHVNDAVWRMLFQHVYRAQFLTEEEEQEWSGWGDQIDLFRGTDVLDPGTGLSWTTDRETALWFARRWADHKDAQPILLRCRISKHFALGPLHDRGESEVILRNASGISALHKEKV